MVRLLRGVHGVVVGDVGGEGDDGNAEPGEQVAEPAGGRQERGSALRSGGEVRAGAHGSTKARPARARGGKGAEIEVTHMDLLEKMGFCGRARGRSARVVKEERWSGRPGRTLRHASRFAQGSVK